MIRFLGRLYFALILAFPALAQFDGRVTGNVIDPTGASVPAATVNLYLNGGKKPLMTTATTADGLYHFVGVRPGYYDIGVEAPGFVKVTVQNLSVDPARETSAPQIKLEVATVAQAVEVRASTQNVETTTAEVSQTVSMEEIRNLPILDRDALSIIQTQPGVASNGNSTTVINGLRTSYSNLTLDGINIQDNYIRDNALDFTPNKLLIGQVRQMTLVSSNANSAASGGATETAFSTPSGTNALHGEFFWTNRNNIFASNDFFSNQAGSPLPRLNQNQGGASVGGPIKKDKMFFYANYEAIRAHQQTPTLTQILTANARQGIFQYRDAAGTLHSANLLTLRQLKGVDPYIANLLSQVPGGDAINNDLVGDGLNTGGYRFNQRSNEIRDNITGRFDYNINTANVVSFTYAWNRDNLDRPDFENDYSAIPKATNPTHTNFLSTSWEWTPNSRLTNELRAGFNMSQINFDNSQDFGKFLVSGLVFNDPINEGFAQGRNTNTYSILDDASFQKGRHFIQFGFSSQQIRVRSSDYSGTTPVYLLGMGLGQQALTSRELPGISQDALGNANALLATLGGFVDSYSETFNVTSRTSGYVPGAPFLRHFRVTEMNFYAQDKLKLAQRLTMTVGVRYHLPGVVSERDGLEVQPVLAGSAVSTLLSDATVNYLGSGAGPWYHTDKKDFAPNLGLAWDPFGDGKTAIRGAYSIFFVNDQSILAPENMLEANQGLIGTQADSGLSDRVSTGLTPVAAPPYKIPIKESEIYNSNPFNILGMVDPKLRDPYVQQYSVGIQHDFKGTVVEARYVGNHAVGAYREFDFNQVNINASGFLQDFLRAQSNGFLAEARNGVFNPAFNAAIPGSQQLTVFPKLGAGGELTSGDVRNLIQTGQPADLAYLYQTNGLNGSVNFFANPYAIGADMLTNYSSSSYNALQVEVRHRMRSGLSFEANYTFSKVLSDADGDSQSRFQAFLDVNNPKIERSRANFDLTHMIKADGFYELPFGKGHRMNVKHLDRVIGGWTFGSTMTWQSGARSRFFRAMRHSTGLRGHTTTRRTRCCRGKRSRTR